MPSDPSSTSARSDFVLWPELGDGRGTGRVASSLREAVEGLAPVAAAEEEEPDGSAVSEGAAADPGAGSGRFYPASRTWFRTTDRIPAEYTEPRWWDEITPDLAAPPSPPVREPAPPPAARAPAAAPAPVVTPVALAAPAPFLAPVAAPPPAPSVPSPAVPVRAESLLSPEEIWELAARELSKSAVLPPAEPDRRESAVLAEESAVEPPSSWLPQFKAITAAPADDPRARGAGVVVSPFLLARPAGAVEAPSVPLTRELPLLPVDEVRADDVVFPQPARTKFSRPRYVRDELDEPPRRRGVVFRWVVAGLALAGLVAAGVIWRKELVETNWGKKADQLWRTFIGEGQKSPMRPRKPAASGAAAPAPAPGPAASKSPAAASPPAKPPASVAPAAASRSTAIDPLPDSPPVSPGPVAPAVREDDRKASIPPRPDESPPGGPGPGAAGVKPPTPSFTLWEGDAAQTSSAPATRAAPLEGAESEAEAALVGKAIDAVRQLVTARSVEDVLPQIFDADKLAPVVREYYATQPLSPLHQAVIELEYSGVIPSTHSRAFIFNVMHPDHPRGFPVSAELTGGAYKIDWQSYVQWRDEWLRHFVEMRPSGPQTLFVVLRRTHYFNDDVPDLDDKLCFKLTSAVPGDEGITAFVDRASAVGKVVAEMYEWRTLYFPAVELQWIEGPKAARYVRLNRIVRPTWRRVGSEN